MTNALDELWWGAQGYNLLKLKFFSPLIKPSNTAEAGWEGQTSFQMHRLCQVQRGILLFMADQIPTAKN